MFSTPLICSSIGATTVEATTSALAPEYWPETLMIGGAISGYCATGSRTNDTAPRITKMIESTEAKIGRSMKKCEIFMTALVGLRLRPGSRRRDAALLRRDLGAGPRPHQAVDDDAVVGAEPGPDDAQIVHHLAEGDVFLAHRAVGADRERVLARLLGADGDIGHEQRLVGQRARDLHPAEHAGRE